MTFAVVMSSPNHMWACADRQLLYGFGPLPSPTAIKIAILQADDGRALLTYAGLGKLNRTEVSLWVTQVLRGINASLNDMMMKIVEASSQKIEPKWKQRFIAVGFGRQRHQGKRIAYLLSKPKKMGVALLRGSKVHLEFAGSGMDGLKHVAPRIRRLRRLVRQLEVERISPVTLAIEFSRLNIAISRAVGGRRNGVSPDCLVVCASSNNSEVKHWTFDASGRIDSQPYIVPFVSNGFVLSDAIGAFILLIQSGGSISPQTLHSIALGATKPSDENFY